MANVSYQGEVTEWFKVTVLKTVVGQLTASSNLALSATHSDPIGVVLRGGEERRINKSRYSIDFYSH